MLKCGVDQMQELKNQAQAYYGKCGPGDGVVEKVEAILNDTFYQQPNDIYGYLVKYFDQFCISPSIAKMVVDEVPDCKGRPTIQAHIYCLTKNEIKLEGTAVSVYSRDYELKLAAGYNSADLTSERVREVTEARRFIEAFSIELLHGVPVRDQCFIDTSIVHFFKKMQTDAEAEAQAAAADAAATAASQVAAASVLTKNKEEGQERGGEDRAGSGKSKKSVGGKKKGQEKPEKSSPKMSKSRSGVRTGGGKNKSTPGGGTEADVLVFAPDGPFECFYPGSVAVSAVSQAVCRAGASASGLSLYQHIHNLISCPNNQVCEEEHGIPNGMFTILSGGRWSGGGGKLKSVKDFILIPSPSFALTEAIQAVNTVYNYCSSELIRRGNHIVNDCGVLAPGFEKVEEGLSLICEALNKFSLTPGADFYIALNCASHEIYMPSMEKYEVSTGRYLTSAELVSYWSDLWQAYPSIVAFIDPFRKSDEESWMSLHEAVGSQCHIIGDYVYGRPGALYSEIYNRFCQHSTVECANNQGLPTAENPQNCRNTTTNNKFMCDKQLDKNQQVLNGEDCMNNNAKVLKAKSDKPTAAKAEKQDYVEDTEETVPVVVEVEEECCRETCTVLCKLRSHAAILRLEHTDTLTDLLSCYRHLKGQCMEVVIGAGAEHTPDNFSADLAVGLGARFIWLGCVSKGESCLTVARLLQIERDLRTAGTLRECPPQFNFLLHVSHLPEENVNDNQQLAGTGETSSAEQQTKSKAECKK